MLNRPFATHPSQIFFHPCSNNSKTRLEAFVYALTFWNGLGWDFCETPQNHLVDFLTLLHNLQSEKEKTTSIAEKCVKTNAFFRHLAICEYAKQAHISGFSHQNAFFETRANKMPLCSSTLNYYLIKCLRWNLFSFKPVLSNNAQNYNELKWI